MANTKSSSLGPGLSTAERVAGFCYLPFYAVLLAILLPYGAALLGLRLTELQLNLCFFVINVLMVWLIFHNFPAAESAHDPVLGADPGGDPGLRPLLRPEITCST